MLHFKHAGKGEREQRNWTRISIRFLPLRINSHAPSLCLSCQTTDFDGQEKSVRRMHLPDVFIVFRLDLPWKSILEDSTCFQCLSVYSICLSPSAIDSTVIYQTMIERKKKAMKQSSVMRATDEIEVEQSTNEKEKREKERRSERGEKEYNASIYWAALTHAARSVCQ